MSNKKNRIPRFKTTKQEADFWDSHDIGEFMDELKVVKGSYSPSGDVKTTMTIRLDPGLKKKVDKIAKSHDISTSSLVRMWLVDKLRVLSK